MKQIFDKLQQLPEITRLCRAIKSKNLPAAAFGLSYIHKIVVMAALLKQNDSPAIAVFSDEGEIGRAEEDLNLLGINTAVLPARNFEPRAEQGYSKEYEQIRIGTLSKLLEGACDVVLLTPDSLSSHVIPPKMLKDRLLDLKICDELSPSFICEKLIMAGYTLVDIVEATGQFAHRGGIVDIFSANLDEPVRLEFFGDEIDSISFFDPETQRRNETVKKICITPAAEAVFDPLELKEKISSLIKSEKKANDQRKSQLSRDLDRLNNGLSIASDAYLPQIFQQECTVFDYLPNSTVFLCESSKIFGRVRSSYCLELEGIDQLILDGILPKKALPPMMSSELLLSSLAQRKTLLMESFFGTTPLRELKMTFDFNFAPAPDFIGNTDLLCEDIKSISGIVIILGGTEKSAISLKDDLVRNGIHATFLAKDTSLDNISSGIFVAEGNLSQGFALPSEGFALITCRRAAKKKAFSRYKAGKELSSIEELRRGCYVVHSAHGIGVFDGVEQMTSHGVTRDYIKIKYLGRDVLYVPVTSLDLVSKYIGAAEDGGVKLHRLGSKEWTKTRLRVKAAVRDMAKQLTALYSKRMTLKGHAFPADSDLQYDFEARFPFEETEDQLRCSREIKKDMEKLVPMDRLLCGDVGFGKTEVALRAAFKCVADGKQCALLVPTTILAWQHYRTASERFGDLPIEVEMLSRFRTKKEQDKIKQDLKNGKLDMIIGTHRIISSDIKFHDLGLVIIDEEQRFGVAQKERLKEEYPQVDVLTLSATPIPRTLNMALSGLRDMSSIEEAPHNRQPVQTYVLEQNRGVLLEAISRELRRGGQVYYLHNRTESISTLAVQLQHDLPEAKVGVAHGKMNEEQLSSVWKRLLDHDIDVLVCTTIIETGVDVSDVNTIIIEDADRMGLSQLHQLRGRVGRSSRRAFAYLCFKGGKSISDIAQKRLEAIREFTEFGSGFKIAMRDLEIRGAGNILSGDQHGHLESVGYEMYIKMLSDAIEEEKGNKKSLDTSCVLELRIEAHIPEKYIESLPARLGVYRRIASIKNAADKEDVIDELIDRFGEPDAGVLKLMDISLLRSRAESLGITDINENSSGLILRFAELTPERVLALASKYGKFITVGSKDNAVAVREKTISKDRTILLETILSTLENF